VEVDTTHLLHCRSRHHMAQGEADMVPAIASGCILVCQYTQGVDIYQTAAVVVGSV
jgi:5,10-methylene-tetrahydrofolate dehydrogenase/methenyl tetrahydrofolate cyclohydrolase